MVKKRETPYPATKRGLPWEIKYNYVRGMLTTLFKGFMHEIREEYGAAEALKIYERLNQRSNRVKKMGRTLKDVFNIEGSDIDAIMRWWEIFYELVGIEATWLEVTKTYARVKITKCPWSTPDPKDISDWSIINSGMINQALNPKAATERPKGMCAGDPHCEYIFTIEK